MQTSDNKIADFLKKRILVKITFGIFSFIIGPTIILSCLVLIIAGMLGDDIEIMRSIEIPGQYLIMAREASDDNSLDFIKLLTVSASISSMEEWSSETLQEALSIIDDPLDESDQELYEIYRKCYETLVTGPIPLNSYYTVEVETSDGKTKEVTREKTWHYTHYEDFGDDRTYGGDRRHEGNDIVARKGTPIVSISDGYIKDIGWSELGGWRVGIEDRNGTYFYYAHMNEYADIYKGQGVSAGTLLGYVGNTGYGPEGTSGQFIDHLHMQIGIELDEESSVHTWINPYPIVEYLDPYRITLEEDE